MSASRNTGPLGLFILATLMLLLLPSCGDEPPPLRVNMALRQEIPLMTPSRELTYAYLPQYTPAVSFKRQHLIVEHIAQSIGLPVRQVFPESFADHMTMFGQGRIDISFSNPFVYIQIAKTNGARAIARAVDINGTGLSGQIICRQDRQDLVTLADCRGKRWIATDPSSAGGFLYPLGLILESGLRKSDFAEIAFAGGNQEKVVYSVYRGEYDIGTIRNGTLDVMRGQMPVSEIRVLAQTRPYPNWVYAVRGGLDPAIADKIQAALISLDPQRPGDKTILDQAEIERFTLAADSDFEPLRALLQQIGHATALEEK